MPELQFREIELRAAEADGDLIPCVLASETEVDRGGYLEVLSCRPTDVDLSRAPLPLIIQHDHTQLNIGVIEQVRVEAGKVRGLARFGSSSQAKEILADVKAGIVRSLSVGYELLKSLSEAGRTVRFAWRPYECSLVSVPADPQAGFYRSLKGHQMTDITVTENDPAHLSRAQRRAQHNSVEDERERTSEILALGRTHNVQDLATRAVNDGTTVDDFRALVLARLKTAGVLRAAESPDIGLSQREVEQFSFRRAILAQLDPHYASREAGFEMEASRAMAQKLGRDPQGLFVPSEVLRHQTRDLAVGTASAGGYLKATDHLAESFVDVLRNASHVMTLGALQLPDLVGDVAIPSKTAGAAAYWVAEGGGITEGSITFGQVPLTPKTVGSMVDYTRKLLKQSSPAIEGIVRADLAAGLGVELDRVSVNGSGANNEPTGILYTNGIGSVAGGANGAAPTYDHMVDLESSVADVNAALGALAYLTNTKVRGKLRKTQEFASTNGKPVWGPMPGEDGFGLVNGYRAAASNNVPSNLNKGTSVGVCSAVVFGNWADLMIGMWGGLDVLVDPYTLSASGGVRVVALLDVDVAVRRAVSFAAMKDALTA